MTFSAELRCYIGSHTLAPWPTVLAGVLPSWLMALGPDVVAHCARPLAPWCMAPSLAHAKGPLPAAPTAVGHVVMSLSRGPRRQMYVFAKFVANHIFLQNRDKINIKNSNFGHGHICGPFFLREHICGPLWSWRSEQGLNGPPKSPTFARPKTRKLLLAITSPNLTVQCRSNGSGYLDPAGGMVIKNCPFLGLASRLGERPPPARAPSSPPPSRTRARHHRRPDFCAIERDMLRRALHIRVIPPFSAAAGGTGTPEKHQRNGMFSITVAPAMSTAETRKDAKRTERLLETDRELQ
jgi:hypothetical protein